VGLEDFGSMEDFVHECGFTVVYVSDDCDISNIHNVLTLFEKARKDGGFILTKCKSNVNVVPAAGNHGLFCPVWYGLAWNYHDSTAPIDWKSLV
jgi:hypothetical protein